jgi:hypothetical protein
VRLAITLEPLVDLVGQPQERELAQRGQVADPEVVSEGRIDFLGLVDVAVGHPAAQRLGRHVDQLDLIGGPDDGIRHCLPLRDAGDLFHDVVERLQVLDVHRGDDVDASVEQLPDVLPALLVARARHVCVRELLDERDLGATGQDRVEVHLLEGGAAIRQRRPRYDLEVTDLLEGMRTAVGFDVADHHVGAALVAPVTLVEHGERLADAGR